MGHHWCGGHERRAGRNGGGRAGHGTRGVKDGPIAEKEVALLDEEFYDCLINTSGSESIHGAEVGSHQGGPEADGEVLARHQIHFVVVAHPARQRHRITPG